MWARGNNMRRITALQKSEFAARNCLLGVEISSELLKIVLFERFFETLHWTLVLIWLDTEKVLGWAAQRQCCSNTSFHGRFPQRGKRDTLHIGFQGLISTSFALLPLNVGRSL
jgi:hypothetical protein